MTGLIYVAIIALWAAVLIPIWLRRNDADEVRAVDRFDNAMHALGRFRRGQRDSDVLVKGERVGATRSSSSAAGRRLLVQIGLVVLTVVVGVAWLVGAAPGFLVVVVGLLTAAYAIAARRLTALEQAARRRRGPVRAERQRRTPREQSARAWEDEVDEDFDEQPMAPTRRTAPAPQRPRPGRRRTIVFDDIDLDTGYDAAAPTPRRTRRDGEERLRPTGSAWEAVPTTLPTYVDAPAASAIPRNIDRDGAWGADAMLEQARGRRPAPADFFDQYADEQDFDLTHRRAVGE